MTARSDSVLSRTVLSTTGMAVQGLARFLYTLAIGRLANPEALADVSALLSLSVYFALLLPAGLGIAASRYFPDRAMAPLAARQLSRWFWTASPLLALIALPIAYWIVGDLPSAIGCALLVFAYNAYVFTRGALLGEDRILRAMLADLFSSLLAITALVFVLIGDADWALLLPVSAGYLIFALAARKKTPSASEIDPESRKTLRRFLIDATIGGLATGGLLPATMIFVRAFDSPEQAGMFAAALSLATPANLLAQAIQQVLIPHFARFTDVRSAVDSHRKLLLTTTVLFAIVFGLLILLSPLLITWLYGERYAGGAGPMQVLLAVVFLISATSASAAFLISTGHQRAFAKVWSAGFVLGFLIMLLTAPFWGMWGALAGFAVGGGGGALALIFAAVRVRGRSVLPVIPHAEKGELP